MSLYLGLYFEVEVGCVPSKGLVLNGESCKHIGLWEDKESKRTYSLIEAPDKSAIIKLHNFYNYRLPVKILEINLPQVKVLFEKSPGHKELFFSEDKKSLLDAQCNTVFLLSIQTDDQNVLAHRVGEVKALELKYYVHESVKRSILANKGQFLETNSFWNIIGSFTTENDSLLCATNVRENLGVENKELGLRIVLHAIDLAEGEAKSLRNLLMFFSSLLDFGEIVVTSSFCKLSDGAIGGCKTSPSYLRVLSSEDELFLKLLWSVFLRNWQNTDFNGGDFSKEMSTSKSGLYRKCVNVAGKSPNRLLRNYRLNRALNLLRDKSNNISQIAFEVGFSTPSYFSKCFKDTFGIKPQDYLQ